MFKNLNLEGKIRIKTRVSQVVTVSTAVISIIGIFQSQKVPDSALHWGIASGIVAIVGIVFLEFLKKWVNKTISNPIHKAVMHTTAASNEIIEATTKQEGQINKHLQLLKDTENVIQKLNSSSLQTKLSAQKVAEQSQEALSMSSKEQEAVHANIDKMRTLKQKIQIIAELILELSEHTQQIGSIIGVVEDITEQTNMLALNAAVEAARAGEHGKGFAVVASEIRKLADESKQATTKISALIHDIQQATNSTVMATEEGSKEIETGVELAHQIAQSINLLKNIINETALSVEGIVNAAGSQSSNAREVSEVVKSLNTGLTESAGSLKQNISILQGLINVSKFLKTNVVGNTEQREVSEFDI